MRELWFQLDKHLPVNLKKKLLEASTRACNVILVDSDDVAFARKIVAKPLAAQKGGDIEICEVAEKWRVPKIRKMGKKTAVKATLRNLEDLDTTVEAVELSPDYVIVSCPNWKVIPMENLIAKLHGKSKLLAEVGDAKEAYLALETLELGADGVVLKTADEKELTSTLTIVKQVKTRLEEKEELPRTKLVPAKVIKIKPLRIGARVCIDTCDLMKRGEGMLIGSQSSGLFFVQAEVEETPHVPPRPFRVNAGPVSLYVLIPGDRTEYLSQLKAGDEVLIVDREGRTRSVVVGRVKIEWRPLALVEAEAQGRRIKTIVQNAETIRLVTPKGSKSIAELKPGDKVLVHIKEGGRHFGTLVKEESVLEQ